MYGDTYTCDHPVYDNGTLFKIDKRGLAVIQQRYELDGKKTKWGEVDPWLTDELYLHPRFKKFFDERADTSINGLYPTVTIRQIMCALKMTPIPRERWGICFDRRPI